MSYTKITKENYPSLKPGMTIKYHNTYEWVERILTELDIERRYVLTGIHNETVHIVAPSYKKDTYFK